MKLALITERIDPSLGGAERSVSELSEELRELGIDVTLLVAKGQSDLKHIKVLCCDQPKKRITFRVFNQALQQHLRDNHYDIVHSVLPFSAADVYQPRSGNYKEAMIRHTASYRNLAISNLKLLTHWINRRRYQWLKAEQELCSERHKTIVAALSEYVKRQYEKHCSIAPERLVTIANGVKIRQTVSKEAAENLRGDLISRFNLKKDTDPVFFLFGGNNFRLKGLGCAIEALSQVTKNTPKAPAYLVIAGNGTSGKYRQLANFYGIIDRVLFLGKVDDIQPFLKACDVNILPTFYDPSSRIVLEGLTFAMPVITTSFNGATDMFTDRRHGIVVDHPTNINALSEALKYFLSREAIDQASQAIVKDELGKNISIRRHARELVKIYEGICSSR